MDLDRRGMARNTKSNYLRREEDRRGEPKTLGVGEFAESTYVEAPTYNPKYVEYLTNDGGSFRYEEIRRADHAEGGIDNSGS